MKIVKNIDDEFVSHVTDIVLSYIGDILDSLEIRLEDRDYVLVDDRKAVISISRDNPLLSDKECAEILLMKRILSLRFSGMLSELLTDREIIRLGLSKKLFYYYYVLLSSPRSIDSIEDFIQINIPWISFYPHDKESSRFLHEMAEKYSSNYRKEFEAAAERLYALLKKNLYTESAIREAEEDWSKIIWSGLFTK